VLQGDVRRDATMEDFRNFSRLAQSFPGLDSAGGVICEPNDAPLDSRHLDMIYALQTLTDKIYMGNVVSGVNARDTIAMTEILFGGRAVIEATPATISLINCNSPLRWDDRMLDAQFEYCEAGQAVVLTPFLLMGAMSPVSIPATLVQQMAEALTGIALSHFLGAAHTMERFRTCFYRPFLSSSDNHARWVTRGAKDAAARAGDVYRARLEEYEQPPIDDAVREELEAYVIRRRAELGD
jgi:trimethylamine:corrinoid methyltransferase-like protein